MDSPSDPVEHQIFCKELSEGDKPGRDFGVWVTISHHLRSEIERIELRRSRNQKSSFKARWVRIVRGKPVVIPT